ncbi:SMI1/KNR4 family protein [Armatimonas rosea]|uniref:Knr4/Smi1-like domain-containing protein n=1 Tax=Armatimonas rosea TaxID=685828 RepID=A0A7W9SNA3_ARMRO|nr:SMI1/KNR4 family protein [Armatimonas rosea]MBB6049762.1 hypothetical protein [Armatimonas rosea]
MTTTDDSHAWLKTVREGIAELTQHYGGYWRREKIVLGSCPTEKELAVREQGLGIRLPEDYRDFLLHIGNGGFGPDLGLSVFPLGPNDPSLEHGSHWPSIPEHEEVIGSPFPHTKARHFFTDTPPDDWEVLTGFLELGDRGCGMYSILVVSGEEYGHVWQTDEYGVGPYEEGYRLTSLIGKLLWPPIRPHRYTFKDWYLDWLQAMLNTARRSAP